MEFSSQMDWNGTGVRYMGVKKKQKKKKLKNKPV